VTDEFWDRWFRRRGWPFFRRGFLGYIDEVFREIEDFMRREFEDLLKETPKSLVRERTLPDGTKVRQWGPFIYGYSVTIGPDGKAHVREFGNVRPGMRLGRPRVDIREEREPLVDVIETDREIKVIAELPGVEKKDIKLSGTEDALTISVDTPERKYYKKVELPSKVDVKETKASYKNGVLEVTLKKKKEPEGEPIPL
jgi:HSP20 family protein